MPWAKSLTRLVNSFHRLGSTDEECCERTENAVRFFLQVPKLSKTQFWNISSNIIQFFCKFQNYPRPIFGTFLPTSFSFLASSKTIQDSFLERFFQHHSGFCKFQNYLRLRPIFGTFLPTSFSCLQVPKLSKTNFWNISSNIIQLFCKFQNYPRSILEHFFQHHASWFRRVSIHINAVLCIRKHCCSDTLEQIHCPCLLSNAELVEPYWCNSWWLQMSLPKKSLQSFVWCRLRESFAVPRTVTARN